MGIFENFPYNNFHELNLDWIIAEVTKVREEWDAYRTETDAQLEEFQTWFDNLDVSDEVRTVVNDMVDSGEFLTVTMPAITSTISTWLQDHITQETGYVIDNTLTVAGAAADAEASGNSIERTGNFVNSYTKSIVANTSLSFYINAHKNDTVVITASDYSVVPRVSLINFSGTAFANSLPIRAKTYLRLAEDAKRITIYASSAVDVTVEFTNEPLYITNYYDKTAKIDGYINNGSVTAGYYHSDYIPVMLGEKIIFNGYPSTFGAVRAHFYDDAKNYVGRINGVVREDELYEIDLTYSRIGSTFSNGNVRYVNFNMTVAGSDTAVFYKNTVPYTLVGFGQHLPDDDKLFFNQIQRDYIAAQGDSIISGLHIAYNGDSIAETRLQSTSAYNGGGYAKMIADITGGTYTNTAHSGGILASAVPSGTMPHSIVNTISTMPDDADLICLEGGINDYWRNVPLGDYSESDYTTAPNTTTICGALESIFRQATQKWVGKPICFVIVHKIKNTVYATNSAGYTFAQAREKMIGICNKYSIPFYDAFSESGLNAYNDIQNTNFLTSNSSGTPDGCHPNEAGYQSYYVPQLIELFNKIMPRN